MRVDIVPPGPASWSTRPENLIDQLCIIWWTEVGSLVSAVVRAFVSRLRSPARELAEIVPLPVLAPVLTPIWSMLWYEPESPLRVCVICWRMPDNRFRRSLSLYSVPWVGSLLLGVWVSWVWIWVIAEL